jgi:hypothetical protein
MKRILTIALMSCLAVFGQKIETRKADRTRITRLATAQNHLSVLEFNEPVKEVAVGSSNFKVEWREDKVFIQPLEPNATTNLFIWTASGRQSYELVPAASVEEMHFAIDEDPATRPQAKLQEAPVPARPATEQPRIPAAMLMESTPVKVLGTSRNHQRVEIVLRDVYQKDERVYVRYVIVNRGPLIYVPAPPEVFTLHSPRAPQSLIPLANTQLASDYPLKWKDEARVRVLDAELQSGGVRPGQSAHGVIAFDLPSDRPAGERTVVRLSFPADITGDVRALLVL